MGLDSHRRFCYARLVIDGAVSSFLRGLLAVFSLMPRTIPGAATPTRTPFHSPLDSCPPSRAQSGGFVRVFAPAALARSRLVWRTAPVTIGVMTSVGDYGIPRRTSVSAAALKEGIRCVAW